MYQPMEVEPAEGSNLPEIAQGAHNDYNQASENGVVGSSEAVTRTRARNGANMPLSAIKSERRISQSNPIPPTNNLSAPVAEQDNEPAYRLSRVQKIVKMDNEQVLISREAVFLLALASEEMTRLIARAGQDIVAKTESSDIHVADIATAVASQESWAFLKETIPQTITLSTARQRRETKDGEKVVDSPTATMIQSVQERMKGKSKKPPTHKTSSATGPRTLSTREAKAVGLSKKGQRSLAPMPQPTGPFDPRLHPAAAGSQQALNAAAMDPESYRNGIRWAPVQATGPPNGAEQGQAPQMWGEVNMHPHFLVPAPGGAAYPYSMPHPMPENSQWLPYVVAPQAGQRPGVPFPPGQAFHLTQIQGRPMYAIAGAANGYPPTNGVPASSQPHQGEQSEPTAPHQPPGEE